MCAINFSKEDNILEFKQWVSLYPGSDLFKAVIAKARTSKSFSIINRQTKIEYKIKVEEICEGQDGIECYKIINLKDEEHDNKPTVKQS